MSKAGTTPRFLAVTFRDIPSPLHEIVMAELIFIGFDSFQELDDSLVAIIPETDYDEKAIRAIQNRYPGLAATTWTTAIIPDTNWNTVWESQYEPVLIAGRCYIRAPFHPPPEQNPYSPVLDIIIEPKMSFGTAHHETTALMITRMLEEELAGKRVLDMGCGTGILAILASLCGASEVVAIDNDRWAYINCRENILKNNVSNISVIHGDATTIPETGFHLILANINRNILIEHLPVYAASMAEHAILLLSGFYREDLPAIRSGAEQNGLTFLDASEENRWMTARFRI